jgi:5'-methylthioinosine phosphorylase
MIALFRVGSLGVTMARLAMIGGTSLGRDELRPGLESTGLTVNSLEEVNIETPWGDVPMTVVEINAASNGTVASSGSTPTVEKAEHTLFVVQRHHGKEGKATPPHKIEFRANMHALTTCQASACIAINNVGSLDDNWPPGSVGVVEDVMCLSGDAWTFSEDHAVHVAMTKVLDKELLQVLEQALRDAQPENGDEVRMRHIYARSIGPQFESPAEVVALRRNGATCVGMTFVPEVRLAAERNMPMCAVVIAGNWGAGMGDVESHLDGDGVTDMAQAGMAPAWKALAALLDHLGSS